MVEILHLIKEHGDSIALEVVREQSKNRDVAVLFIQDGVLDADDVGLDVVYASRPDVEARGILSSGRLLDYPQIMELIFACGKTICW